MKVLNLFLVVDELHVSECAQQLRARLEPDRWAVLAALAAEIVAMHESAALGATRVLVVPEGEAEAILDGRALRL